MLKVWAFQRLDAQVNLIKRQAWRLPFFMPGQNS
jgi:hypothetical protein